MLGKLLVAIPTPFDDNDEVDYDAFEDLIIDLKEQKVDGIVVGGSTGEGHLLQPSELLNLIMSAIRICDKDMKVIASVNYSDTNTALEFVEVLNTLKIDGLLVVVPYYLLPNQEGIYKHFSLIAETSDHPIIIYNVPKRVGTSIKLSTLQRLKDNYDNIIGIKEASNNFEFIKNISECYPDFYIYSGDDKLLLEHLNNGAYGVISVAGNIIGEDIQNFIKSYEDGVVDKKLYDYISLIANILCLDTNPIIIKYILYKKGYSYKNLRLPLTYIKEYDQRIVDELLGFEE